MNIDPYSTNSIRLARVTYVHPEGQKMEVIFLDTGDYGRDVQVMSPYAGTDFGFTSGIPSPESEGHDVNMTNDQDRRHITAVVANIQGQHVALGFLYPQVTEMAFTKAADPDRLIERSPSDSYRTVSGSGDMDFVHPGGAYLRIGKGGLPDGLAGRDFDRKWRIKHNKSPVTVTLSSGGADVTILPDGRIKIQSPTEVEVQSGTKVKATAPIVDVSGGEVVISASSKIVLSAPVIEMYTAQFRPFGHVHPS